jgi:hypothetical protein
MVAPELMTLKQIQAELRAVSGTPLRFEGDRLRRQQLWQRLDRLIAEQPVEEKEKMDTRKFSAGQIKPDDVRDVPRTERITNVYEHEKFRCLVLDLESGDTFNLNGTNTRILNKAWGYESDGWLGQELELSLGFYKDWKDDPPSDKETVKVRAISPAKPEAQNGGGAVVPVPRSFPPQHDTMDDEIPFITSASIF